MRYSRCERPVEPSFGRMRNMTNAMKRCSRSVCAAPIGPAEAPLVVAGEARSCQPRLSRRRHSRREPWSRMPMLWKSSPAAAVSTAASSAVGVQLLYSTRTTAMCGKAASTTAWASGSWSDTRSSLRGCSCGCSSRMERGVSRLDMERTNIERIPVMPPSESPVDCNESRGGTWRPGGGVRLDGGELTSEFCGKRCDATISSLLPSCATSVFGGGGGSACG
mmetsp:Transcript_45831/g.120185  ORF Transcript_45831/g.120185 Transcript_45831/m.120185 type:complete len:221 (-) Transcript_45831:669-1331(-)